MRVTLVCLGVLALLLLACGNSGRGDAHSLAEDYLQAVSEGDAGTLRGLYANERDFYDPGLDAQKREEQEKVMRQSVDQLIERKIAKYAPLKDAEFRIRYIPHTVVGYLCEAVITTRADETFTDYIGMQMFGNHWAILPGDMGPHDPEQLKNTSETACNAR